MDGFATELDGVRLGDLDPAEFRRLMDRHAVCVIRNAAPVSDAEHVEFSRKLGPLLPMKMLLTVGKSKSRFAFPEIIDIGNIDAQGGLLPHDDPPGGADTEFADMRAAYEALPGDTQERIEPLVVEHSVWHSRALGGLSASDEERATRPPSRHRLVHRHPGSGRKALYLASHASHVVGWPLEEGRRLIAQLIGLATQPQFLYRHKWRVGDLLVWDNLQTMHRGTPFDDTRYPRDMRRTTVIEPAVIEEAADIV